MKNVAAHHRTMAKTAACLTVLAINMSSCSSNPNDVGEAPTNLVGILKAEQSDRDLLPRDGSDSVGGPGMVSEMSRWIGGTANAEFWVALDEQRNICLVSMLKKSLSAGISCASPQKFSGAGISTSVSSSNNGLVDRVEAYVAPDGLNASSIPAGLEKISPTLVAGDSRGAEDDMVFSASKPDNYRVATIKMPLRH